LLHQIPKSTKELLAWIYCIARAVAKSEANNSWSFPVLPSTGIKEAPEALLKTAFETEKVKGAANKVRRVAGMKVAMAAMWARIKSET
jgi:hypothetical protein